MLPSEAEGARAAISSAPATPTGLERLFRAPQRLRGGLEQRVRAPQRLRGGLERPFRAPLRLRAGSSSHFERSCGSERARAAISSAQRPFCGQAASSGHHPTEKHMQSKTEEKSEEPQQIQTNIPTCCCACLLAQDIFRKASKRTGATDEEREQFVEAGKIFRFFSGHFAKWRWETLFTVTASLLKMMPGCILLASAFDDLKAEFNITEPGMWDAFSFCISSPEFWAQTKLLNIIAS